MIRFLLSLIKNVIADDDTMQLLRENGGVLNNPF